MNDNDDNDLVVAGGLMMAWGLALLLVANSVPRLYQLTVTIAGVIFMVVPMARLMYFFLTH